VVQSRPARSAAFPGPAGAAWAAGLPTWPQLATSRWPLARLVPRAVGARGGGCAGCALMAAGSTIAQLAAASQRGELSESRGRVSVRGQLPNRPASPSGARI